MEINAVIGLTVMTLYFAVVAFMFYKIVEGKK